MSEIQEICDQLKIDINNVFDLIEMNFNLYQAVSMIWYFYDVTDTNNLKSLSDKGIEDIFRLANNVIEAEEDEILYFDLYNLIRLYKTRIYDSRSEILKRQSKYLNKVLYSFCQNFGITINSDNVEDFKSELELCLMELIDRNYSNLSGEVIQYMDATIKRSFKGYLSSYKKQYSELFLDKEQYYDSNITLKEFVPNNKEDILENLNCNQFSERILQILSELDKTSLTFIILKFQEDYSYEELALFYKISIEEVKNMENEILESLKNNNDLTKKLLKPNKPKTLD